MHTLPQRPDQVKELSKCLWQSICCQSLQPTSCRDEQLQLKLSTCAATSLQLPSPRAARGPQSSSVQWCSTVGQKPVCHKLRRTAITPGCHGHRRIGELEVGSRRRIPVLERGHPLADHRHAQSVQQPQFRKLRRSATTLGYRVPGYSSPETMIRPHVMHFRTRY